MNRHTALAGIALLALAIILASCSSGTGSVSGPQSQSGARPPMPPSANGSARQGPPGGSLFEPGTKLADSPVAAHAYLISGQTLAENATRALSGFTRVVTQLPNGSENVTLKALESQYQDQSYVVAPGQQLYFVEMTFGDDSGGREYRLGDDHAVLVDANGTIVS